MERWRVEYEDALVDWIERQSPSLAQICAVVKWAAVRKALGSPEEALASPDPDRPEDRLAGVPGANVDVHYLAYESRTERLIFVKDITS